MHAKRLYITGGSSAGEHFQPDGQFPNDSDAHIQETCVTTTWMQLCWQLLRLIGEEKYAAALERALFNQILSAQKPDQSGLGYSSPLEGQKPFRSGSPGIRAMDCCNSSGPRALALAPTFVGMTDANGFRINTFAPAKWHVSIDRVSVGITLKSRSPCNARGDGRTDVTAGQVRCHCVPLGQPNDLHDWHCPETDKDVPGGCLLLSGSILSVVDVLRAADVEPSWCQPSERKDTVLNRRPHRQCHLDRLTAHDDSGTDQHAFLLGMINLGTGHRVLLARATLGGHREC